MMRHLPYAALLAEVLIFYRRVLFSAQYVIPWDLPGYHHPLASFVAKCFRNGELPLWDPYTYCGFPFYANLQAQLFYPPAILTTFLSNLLGWRKLLVLLEWQIALHVFLGGVFTYWLLRRLGASRAAATLGATIFQLGGFFSSQTQHLGAVCGGAWLPLSWLSIITLSGRFSWRWTGILALSLSMALLAGFPAVTVVVLVSCFLLASVLVLLRRAPVTLLGVTALSCAWAGLLAAVQLLPSGELARLSTAPHRGLYTGTGGGVPLQGLVSLVVPNYYSIFNLDHYSLPWNLTFLYLYCGIAGLILSVAVVLFRRGKHWPVFALATFLSALWMLGESTPVGKAIYNLLPTFVKSPLYAEFAMLSFILGMSVLAGLGAHEFISPRGRFLSAALVMATALDLTLVGSGRPMNTAPSGRDPIVTAEEFEGSAVTLSRLRELLSRTTPSARIEVVEDSMNWAASAPLTEVPTASGNDPLALARLLKVRLLFCQGDPWVRYYEPSKLDSPVVNFLNVRYILSWAPSAPPAVLAAGLPKVDELPGHNVYENTNALPRFFLVSNVHHAANMEEALDVMKSPGFDPRSQAVVEGPVDFVDGGGPAPASPVKVLRYAPRHVVLETDSPRPSFLVSSETYYPGWRAFVDGEECMLALTNVAFRGLSLPAGKHIVTMRFEPAILWRSAMLSLPAWLLLILAFAFGDNRRKRGPWISSST